MEAKETPTNVYIYSLKLGIAIAFGFVVGQILGVALLALLPGAIVGLLVAYYYVLKKNLQDKTWVTYVHWSNVIAWFLPIIGMAVSVFSLTVAEKVTKNKTKILILGYIGLILTLINAWAGVWVALNLP